MHGEAEARGDIDEMNKQSKRTTRVTKYTLHPIPEMCCGTKAGSYFQAHRLFYHSA